MEVRIIVCSLWLVGAVAGDCSKDQTCDILAKATGADHARATSSLIQKKLHQSTENLHVEGNSPINQAIECAKKVECWESEPARYLKITRKIIMGPFTGIAGAARTVASFGKLLHMVLNKLLEYAATESKISIHNSLTVPLLCTGTHSYQMNRWDGQFPDIRPSARADVNTRTSGNTVGWGDTNAEAYYKVWCPTLNRNLRFMIMIRHQLWIRFKWDDQDVYNPCYDMWVEGTYTTTEKDSLYSDAYKMTRTIAATDSPILVVGSAEVPNKLSDVTLRLKPHVADSRFPVLYEHTNFHGIMHPINEPFVKNLQGFNDKASSLRVPPGMQVAVCEHANFRGNCHSFSGDAAWISMNDAATSAILLVTEPGK